MPLDDRGLLAALRDTRTLAEISSRCRRPGRRAGGGARCLAAPPGDAGRPESCRRGGGRGGDQARSRRGAARLCRGHRRSVLRPWRCDGAGPAVADGPAAPARAGAAGGDPRRGLCGERRGAPDGGDRSDRGTRGRGDGRRDARGDRALRRRHQPADRGVRRRPAGGVPGAGLCAGAVRRARRGGDRARHLVVVEWTDRSAGGGGGGAPAADRGAARAVSDARGVGEPRGAVGHLVARRRRGNR